MTLYSLLVMSILMTLLNECSTLADALRMTGEKPAFAGEIADRFIQTLWQDIMPDTNANLFMGMNNLPIDKQYSLRLLKKRMTPDDVILALKSMDDYIVQTKHIVDSAFVHRTNKEILNLFRTVEPVFLILDIEHTDEEILEAYNRYLVEN